MADPRRLPRKINLSTVIFISSSILLAAALARQVFFAPVTGLADNGDFNRIMADFGIRHITELALEPYVGYFHRTYLIEDPPSQKIAFLTSEKLFVQAGVWINSLISPKNLLDIRSIGGLHVLAYWIAGTLLLYCFRKGKLLVQLTLSFLLVVILSDVGYVQYFNSFYSEPASIIGMLLLAGLTVYLVLYNPRGPIKTLLLVVYPLVVVLLVTSKPQNAPIGFLLAIWVAWFLSSEIPGNRARLLISGTAGLALFVISIYQLSAGVSTNIAKINQYNSVFMGVLKVSTDPVRDLRELKIAYPKKFAMLAGVDWWSVRTTEYIKQNPKLANQLSTFSYKEISLYYLKHPLRFYQLSKLACRSAYETRFANVGNFEVSTGVPPNTSSNRFNTWSVIKRNFIPRQFLFYGSFFIANIVSMALAWQQLQTQKRLRRLPEFHLLLILLANIEFFTSILGEGLADIMKHLLLFNLTWDLCLLFLLFYGVQLITVVVDKRVVRYG